MSIFGPRSAVTNCKVLEDYPDDRPLPSGLVFGYTETKRPIHVVLALDEEDDMI